jgi:hypothetical protein
MASKSKTLSREEFASLLTVGNCSVLDSPAVIPATHSARLIGLGYMVHLAGRLRMTSPGRRRIAAGFKNRPPEEAANQGGLKSYFSVDSAKDFGGCNPGDETH